MARHLIVFVMAIYLLINSSAHAQEFRLRTVAKYAGTIVLLAAANALLDMITQTTPQEDLPNQSNDNQETETVISHEETATSTTTTVRKGNQIIMRYRLKD